MTRNSITLAALVLVMVLTLSRRASQKLDQGTENFESVRRGDFPKDLAVGGVEIQARALGQMKRLASYETYPSNQVVAIAISLAQEHQKGTNWIAEFVRGYFDRPPPKPWHNQGR